MLQVLPVWVVREECKAGQLRLSDADPLVQSVEELLHRGGTVETHHLCERNVREPRHFELKAQLSHLVGCLAESEVHVCRPEDSLFRPACCSTLLVCLGFCVITTSITPTCNQILIYKEALKQLVETLSKGDS